MQQYRRMLTLPGVRALLVLMFFARIPVTAAMMTLTLHVAIGLDRGYGPAGLVTGAMLVGIAIGAPLMGRIIDRYGLRPMLLLTTTAQVVFWSIAQFLPYPALVVGAVANGVLAIPVTSIGRQALGVIVPEDQRRTAYSLDSISVELTFMVGPMVAVVVSTQTSTTTLLAVMACAYAVSGAAIALVNPTVRAAHEHTAAPVPRREWLTPHLRGVFAVASGATFVLGGMEVAAVAALRETGQLEWTGLLIIAMCVASAVGGVVHGAVRRSLPQVVLMGLLGLLVLPAGLAADGPWWLLALALFPSNLMCAPTIASTGETVAKLAPAAARGEATGLQGSSLTLGSGIGFPVIGFVVDHSSPGFGLVAAGLVGLAVAAVATALSRRRAVLVPA